MEDKVIERIFATGIQIGVISLATELGLIDENISEKQAFKKYGERQVKEWRHKRWIVAYPSGNAKRARYYYKRSELETASRMLSIQNSISPSKINQIMSLNLTHYETKKTKTERPKARRAGLILR